MSDQDNKPDQGSADPAGTETKPLFSIGTRDYKDVDDVVNKITNADNHISTLEKERKADKDKIQELEEKLAEMGDQSSKLDTLLDKLGNSNSQAGQTDQVDIESLRKQLLEEAKNVSVQTSTALEQQKLAEANTLKNIEIAKKKFGSDYEAKLRDEASVLGYSDQDIQKLAAGDPERFKRLFNLDVTSSPSELSPNARGGREIPKPKITNLPNPANAFNSQGRVNALQARLEAKLKEKGLA